MVCDMEIARGRRDPPLPVLPGGDAFARAPHLHRRCGPGCRTRRPRRTSARARCSRTCRTLYALYKVLARARDKRGAIDFETVELALVFDEHGKIEKIVPAPRNDAHKLIEECMLAANVCAADFLAKAEPSGALPRARGADAREARAAARIPRRERALAGRRRRAARRWTTRSSSTKIKRAARLRAAADGAAALAAAGALPARQRRPLRPRLRGLRALHVADPPLSRPAGAPRDQGVLQKQALPAGRARPGRSSASIAR